MRWHVSREWFGDRRARVLLLTDSASAWRFRRPLMAAGCAQLNVDGGRAAAAEPRGSLAHWRPDLVLVSVRAAMLQSMSMVLATDGAEPSPSAFLYQSSDRHWSRDASTCRITLRRARADRRDHRARPFSARVTQRRHAVRRLRRLRRVARTITARDDRLRDDAGATGRQGESAGIADVAGQMDRCTGLAGFRSVLRRCTVRRRRGVVLAQRRRCDAQPRRRSRIRRHACTGATKPLGTAVVGGIRRCARE